MSNDMVRSSLEVLATLAEKPIALKEVVDDWLLFVYDLPNTPEGNEVRTAFLHKAHMHGAVQHTQSVYLMPWTDQANRLALMLSDYAGGKGTPPGGVLSPGATVWFFYANQPDPVKRAQMTVDYDRKLADTIDELGERVKNIAQHVADGRTGVASRMFPKTQEQFAAMHDAVLARGSQRLAQRLVPVGAVLDYLRGLVDVV